MGTISDILASCTSATLPILFQGSPESVLLASVLPPLLSKAFNAIKNGIIEENPTFIQVLGTCPTLAVTTSAINGLGMGFAAMVVLICSNMVISALKNIIPGTVRIPCYIVVIAGFVTIVQLVLQAFVPSLYASLGLFIPLIVVNCIILGRAEAYASKYPVLPSIFDGLGMGLGFTLALTCIGAIRELIGDGAVFGYHIMPGWYEPVKIMVLAPGAFFVLAALTAIQNKVKIAGEKKFIYSAGAIVLFFLVTGALRAVGKR